MFKISRYVGLEEDSWICPMVTLKNRNRNREQVSCCLHCPFYWKICEELFHNTKSGNSLINIDDSHRLTWLLEKETFMLANYWRKHGIWGREHFTNRCIYKCISDFLFFDSYSFFILSYFFCTDVTLMCDEQGWKLFVCI